jgi:hypothetical protein
MTEDQIERIADRTMDRLDRELSRGIIDQQTYDLEVRELDRWCLDEYRQARARQYREW